MRYNKEDCYNFKRALVDWSCKKTEARVVWGLGTYQIDDVEEQNDAELILIAFCGMSKQG